MLEELKEALASHARLMPVPRIPRPSPPSSDSARLWSRHRQRQRLWRVANGYLGACNQLYHGCQPTAASAGNRASQPGDAEAWTRVQRDALDRAQRVIEGRRGFALTGVHAVAECFGLEPAGYAFKPAGVRQVAFEAALIDEPASENTVSLLEALPEEEGFIDGAMCCR